MMLVDEFSGLLKRKMGLDSRSIGAPRSSAPCATA